MLFSYWLNFGGNPFLFWSIGHLFIGTFTCWLLLRNRPINDFLFFVAVFLFSGIMRLPVFLYNLPLNLDESQMLAQGITLAFDPLFYRSVDPTTSGPINSYLLTLLYSFGFRLDFHLAHILSWLLSVLPVFYLYKTLKILISKHIAQLATLPVIVFFSFIQNADLVHYYSEGIAILFLCICTYLLARWTVKQTISLSELIVFGVFNSLIVLCKIQALPLAFVLGVWSLVLIYFFQKANWVKYVSAVSGAILLVWGGWLCYMQANGLLNDFILYYIKANAQLKIHFSEKSSFFHDFIRFPATVRKIGMEFNYYIYPFIGLGLVFFIKTFSKQAFVKMLKQDHFFWLMVLGYFFAVVAVVVRTGSYYTHHFLFFILPMCLFTGRFLHQIGDQARWKWLLFLTQLIFILNGIKYIRNGAPINNYPTDYSKQNEISAVGKAILKYANPKDYLVVWGWSCEYHVETQMPQGVNENHSVRTAMKHPLQEVYYQRYLHDIQHSKPKVFVDAVTTRTFWMNDPKLYGHQNYPELAKFIADHYTLKQEINGVKIYVSH